MRSLFLFFGMLMVIPLCAQQTKPADPDSTVYTFVEVSPEFPGGEAALMKFLSTNMVYPPEYADKNISGTVFISFVVTKDGSLRDIKVYKEVPDAPLFSEQAKRVIGMMPKWLPGKMKGKPVDVVFNLPIRFVLNEVNEDKK